MKSQTSLPCYPHSPIRSLASLARALDVSVHDLQRIAARANTLYRKAKPIPKADGTMRQPYDALDPLKPIHRKIQRRILSKVVFPCYLTGSLKGRSQIGNAAMHAGAAVVVCEDIEQFFPNVSSARVNSIWTNFFGFAADVADLITALTVLDGALPQGAITSSYLANLALWDKEPNLSDLLRKEGIIYTRYVDDVTLSSREEMTNSKLTWAIAKVYGMMKSLGLKAKRSKQEIQRSNGRMRATKLVVNKRPAMAHSERQAIRAAVYQLEKQPRYDIGEFRSALNSISGRVSRLALLHPNEGAKLKARVKNLRDELNSGCVAS